MLLLFSKGRSLPARTQPPSPSPSICSWSFLLSSWIRFWTNPLIHLTPPAVLLLRGNPDKDGFYYLEYKKCIRKLLWSSILKWNSYLLSQTNTEFSTVAFSCLPVFFHTFLHLLSMSRLPLPSLISHLSTSLLRHFLFSHILLQHLTASAGKSNAARAV